MKSKFGEVMAFRRSYYDLTKKASITDAEIKELIAHAVKHTPSAHNTQVQRVILLLNGHHDRFWDMVMDAIRGNAPKGQNLKGSEEKIGNFKNGYGTILFFNDDKVTRAVQDEMPLYSDTFPLWAHHANAMLQFALWNMLEEAGMGASLQHYNPIVDQRVYKGWNVNPNWKLVAQMPFGIHTDPPWDKTFEPIEGKRFLVYE